MPEWKPGVLPTLLQSIERHGRANQRRGMLLIAAAIEAKAKAELGKRSHRSGTPTPAGRGQPPALVTGTGRRSIGHQYLPSPTEPIVRVGTLANIFPPANRSTTGKGSRSRATAGTTGERGGTPSSKYLMYQEKEPRFGHPFLLPSYHDVVHGQTKIWLESFRTWPRI